MDFKELHKWPTSPHIAGQIQEDLRQLVIKESCFEKLEYITAIDTAYDIETNQVYATAVTMKYPELLEIEKAVAEMNIFFPYIPTLLGFREGPVILKAVSKLDLRPDLLLFAGHGLAHPSSFGIASHLGLLIDIPSIGCARKSLAGQYDQPENETGQYNLISVANIECGYVYRSRKNVKPIFISPGHKCNLEDSLDIIENCLRHYRMPQPLRVAHQYAAKFCRSCRRQRQTAHHYRKDQKNKYNKTENKQLTGHNSL